MGLWSRLERTFRGNGHNDEIQEELEFHLAHGRRRRARPAGDASAAGQRHPHRGADARDGDHRLARFGIARRALRRAPVAQGSGVGAAVVLSLAYRRGREHGDLQPRGRRAAEAAAGEGSRLVAHHRVDLRGIPSGSREPQRLLPAHRGRPASGLLDRRRICIGVSARSRRRSSRSSASRPTPDAVAIASDAFPAEQATLQYASSNFFQGLGAQPVAGAAVPRRRRPCRRGARRGDQPSLLDEPARRPARGARPSCPHQQRCPRASSASRPPGSSDCAPDSGPTSTRRSRARWRSRRSRAGTAPRGEQDWNWWVRQIGRVRSRSHRRRPPGRSSRASFATCVVPEGAASVSDLVTLPGRRGLDALNAARRNALWILMLLVGVLLLIVCANVANLLLSRSVGQAARVRRPVWPSAREEGGSSGST